MRIKHFIAALVVVCIFTNQESLSQNVKLDKKLGAENAKLVEQQYGIYQDEALTAYVSAVGNRLVEHLEKNVFEFQFQIADDPIPNAFALPGGYIYVTRGFLSLVVSEDELACVMAHEVIHVTERHSVNKMRNSVLPGILELPGAIVGGLVSEDLGNLINAPIGTSNALFLSSYGRSQETEADTKGINLAAKAGYDPSVMSDILLRVSGTMELISNQKEKKSYFDDHPFTPDRVEKIHKKVANIDWTKEDAIEPNFTGRLNGLTFGYNPSKGVFKENKFLHPNLDFSMAFPKDWYTNNQPNSVGAIQPDQKAAIYLSLGDPEQSAKQQGELLINKLQKKYKNIPVKSGPKKVHNNTAYFVSFIDNSGDELKHVYIQWLELNDLVLEVIGFSPKKFEQDIHDAAESVQGLSEADRSSIEENYIHMAEAKKGESLSRLNSRSKNILSSSLTAMMNGISENTSLTTGQLIKIVKTRKYKSE